MYVLIVTQSFGNVFPMPASCWPCVSQSVFAMPTFFHSAFTLILVNVLLKVASSQDGMDNSNFEDIYKAIINGLSYFNREYKNLDSDAVFGLRVVEGYISRIIQETENGNIKLSLEAYNNMTELLNRVSEVVKKIVPLVQENDPLFYPALNSPWVYYKDYRFLELLGVSERQESKPDDQERYSHCVREVVGSRRSQSETCTISDECRATMMSKGAPNNVLYYQSLFFILGEAVGCHDKLLSRLEASRDKLATHLQHICSLAYFHNAWAQFQGGGDPEGLMLIIKLSFSCGLLGYHELLTGGGLSNAVAWQLESGCYGDYTRMGERKMSETEAGKATRELKSAYLGNGCISDATGAGLGLLAVYLRWVLDPPPQVQAWNLAKTAQEEAQTVSLYMFGLVLLTIAFLFAVRRSILQMAVTCRAILFGERTR